MASALLLTAILAFPIDDGIAVEAFVTESLQRWDVPGAGVVVVRDDKPLVLAGYGRKHHARPEPMSADTVFPLASCSKAFTATLAAMLVAEGTLGWDDPVRKHLPSFQMTDPNVDALVTLRDLFSHRTGVGGHDLLWYHAPWNLDETIRRANKLPQERPFRGHFQYSSVMVSVGGRAIAARAGKPWEELLRERITGPLGMAGVTFTTADPKFRAADTATGHRSVGGKLEPMPRYETTEPNPAGSINLTPRDMVAWLRFHLNGGTLDGKRLLTAEALAETHTPQMPMRMDAATRRQNPDTVQMSYGLGWVVYDHRGRKIVAHGGVIDGFRVLVLMVPERRLGMAVFSNRHGSTMNQALAYKLVDHYLGLPAKDWDGIGLAAVKAEDDEKAAGLATRAAARRADVQPMLPAAGYARDYEDTLYGVGKVRSVDGKLTWTLNGFVGTLVPWEGETFRVADGFFAEQLVEFRVRGGSANAARFMGRVFDRK